MKQPISSATRPTKGASSHQPPLGWLAVTVAFGMASLGHELFEFIRFDFSLGFDFTVIKAV